MLFEARAAGDVRRVLALLDPDIEAQAMADGDAVRGIAEVRRMFGRESATGARVEVDAHRIEQVSEDEVHVHGRIRVIDRGSLADSPGAWCFTVKHGRLMAIAPLVAESPALRHVA